MNRHVKFTHVVVAVFASALAWQPGCSFLSVTPAPVGQSPSPLPQATAPCTRRMAAPVWDTIGAAGIGAFGLLTASVGLAWRDNEAMSSQPSWDPEPDYVAANTALTLGIGALVLAAVTGASAVYGYHTVHECRTLYPVPPRMPRHSQPRWLPPPTAGP